MRAQVPEFISVIIRDREGVLEDEPCDPLCMHVCVCVCMYVCVCVRMDRESSAYACMYVCIRMYACMLAMYAP